MRTEFRDWTVFFCVGVLVLLVCPSFMGCFPNLFPPLLSFPLGRTRFIEAWLPDW